MLALQSCLQYLAFAIFVIVIALLQMRPNNFALHSKPTNSYRPTFDIVVSMYKEDVNRTSAMLRDIRALASLSNLTITTYVYVKDSGADAENIRHELNTTHVSILPNRGREAGTYLTHILKHWDDLAKHTMFIQADMHKLEDAKGRILDWFTPHSGFLPLGQLESCDCIDCKDPWDDTRTFPRIQELYSALNGELCPRRIALTYFGQMIVSAARIRSRRQDTYRYLKSVLESDMDHFIHTDPKQRTFGDNISDPYFGHTVERSYMVLWDCADPGIVERCGGPSGLASRRMSDQLDSHCQCVDQ